MSHQRLLEARENWGDQITNRFSLHPIGWESDLSFLDQSQQTESFSVVCHNNKTKVITTANQKKGKHFKSQWELKVKTIKLAKAPETRVSKLRLFLILHLIGWDDGASFLDQSQSEVRQNQSTLGLLLKISWKLLYKQT